MYNRTIPLLFLAASALSSCGGSSNSDDTTITNPGTADSGDASAIVADDNASTDNSTDANSNAGTDASTAASGIESNNDSGTTADTADSDQSSTVSTASVCGSIENSFTYDLMINSFTGVENGFGISSPVAGIGWDGTGFCDMDNSTGVAGIAVLIPQIETAPLIDGISDNADPEWATSAWTGIINNITDNNITSNLLESNVADYIDGSRPGEWFASHDSENLYLRFLVRNESSSSGNNQFFRDSADARDDDSIDIFIDGDNSKGSSYDGVNDFHVTLAILDDDTGFQYGTNSADSLLLNSGTTVNRERFAASWYEVQINLESAGIVVGHPFGFEIQLNEDDNGGVRDAKFGWFEPTGSVTADSNPGIFGTVLLTGCDPTDNTTFCGTNQLLNPAL